MATMTDQGPQSEVEDEGSNDGPENAARHDYQLPRTLIPTHYKLFIFPDIDRAKFLGHVIIDLNVEFNCRQVVFNALGLSIHSTELHIGDTAVPITSVKIDYERETVQLSLGQTLTAGTHAVLRMSYTGPICTSDGKGFYICSYSNGEFKSRQRFLCTYFEPTETRRLFPCWDEPIFRAVFEITVACGANSTVVSNSPVHRQTALEDYTVCPFQSFHGADASHTSISVLQTAAMDAELDPSNPPLYLRPAKPQQLVQFSPTPIMCTYLVALIIGPLHYIEQVTETGIPVRVYVPSAVDAEWGRFVLGLAAKAVLFWEKFFDFGFPLPKIDIIGVPELSALGMENVGCQVFHLDYLIVNDSTPLTRRQRIARLVGHEISHQWFGNIVAIEWWSHLWLKEGFARYLEFLFVDHAFPEWDYWMFFLGVIYHTVLLLDMDPTRTHPVERDVQHPREVVKVFDAISYEKGATIINMLLAYLGPERTSQAMHTYVKRHCYKNVNSTALWQAIQDVAGEEGSDITTAIQHWLSNSGHPMVQVEVAEDDNGTSTYTLTQCDMPPPSSSTSDRATPVAPYWIPLRVLQMDSQGSQLSTSYLVMRDNCCTFTAPSDHFIKFNHKHHAVCRTNYSAPLWHRLLKVYDRLCSADRLGLAIDIITFCFDSPTTDVPLTLFLELLQAVNTANEQHPIIWNALAKAVSRLLSRCSSLPWKGSLCSFLLGCHKNVKVLCQPQQQWDVSSYSVSTMDPATCSLLLTNLLHMGDVPTRELLAKLFLEFLDGNLKTASTKYPELMGPIFQAAMLSCVSPDKEEELVEWMANTATSPTVDREVQHACVNALVAVRTHLPVVVNFLLLNNAVPAGVLCDSIQYLLLNPPLWLALLREVDEILSLVPGDIDEQDAPSDRARHWLWWLLICQEYCADSTTLSIVQRHVPRYLHINRASGFVQLVASNCSYISANANAVAQFLQSKPNVG